MDFKKERSSYLYTDIDFIKNFIDLGFLELFPSFKAILKQFRLALGAVKTVNDINVDNALFYESFIRLCETNLWFFLTATGQAHLLYNLFKDNRLLNQLTEYTDQVRKEGSNQENIISVTQMHNDETLKSNHLAPEAYWFYFADPNLSHLEKAIHYDNELKRIRFNHSNEQALVYHDLCQSEFARIHMLETELKDSPKLAAELQIIHIEFRKKLDDLMRMPVKKEDGSFDLDAVKNRTAKIQLLTEDLFNKTESYYAAFSNINDRIQDLLFQRQFSQFNAKAKEQMNDNYLSSQEEQLIPLINEEIKASKEEHEDNIDDLMDKISTSITHLLNAGKEVSEHKNLKAKLESLKDNSKNIINLESLRESCKLFEQISAESKSILSQAIEEPENSPAEFYGILNSITKLFLGSASKKHEDTSDDALQGRWSRVYSSSFAPTAPDFSLLLQHVYPVVADFVVSFYSANDASLVSDNPSCPTYAMIQQGEHSARNSHEFFNNSSSIERQDSLNNTPQSDQNAAMDSVVSQKEFKDTLTLLIQKWDAFKDLKIDKKEDKDAVGEVNKHITGLNEQKSFEEVQESLKVISTNFNTLCKSNKKAKFLEKPCNKLCAFVNQYGKDLGLTNSSYFRPQ